MRLPVILLEVMLSVLMVTIACRTFFPLRHTDRFLAAPYFLCCAAIWLLLIYLGSIGFFLSAIVILLYVLSLFAARPGRLIVFALLLGAAYFLLFILCAWYVDESTKGLFSDDSVGLCSLLLSELLFYNALFAGRVLIERRRVPITYFFPCIPLLMTLACIHFFRPPSTAASGPFLAFFLVLLGFDFVCLALQSYLIALLRNREAIRSEIVRQEILENRYKILKEQYQNSFDFLHSLLRSCADLSLDIENKNLERIYEEVSRIASRSFTEFNQVCISTPVLSEVLEQRKARIEEMHVLVSTVLRSDHFGLLTFEEQRRLFEMLVDFALSCLEKSANPVRTLVIKSLRDGQDIILYFRFPGTAGCLKGAAFSKIRQTLSKTFRAGLQADYDPRRQIVSLMLIMPMAVNGFGRPGLTFENGNSSLGSKEGEGEGGFLPKAGF